MKRGVWAVAVAVWLSAIPATAGSIGVGIAGGLSLSRIESDSFPGTESSRRRAADLGLVVEASLSDRFSLVLAPQLLAKGGRVDDPGADAGLRFDLDSLEIPLLAKVRLGQPSRPRPYLLAGASLGFLREARLGLVASGDVLLTEDVKDDLEGREASLRAGAGVEFPVGSEARLFVEGQYAHGLTRLDARDRANPEYLDLRNGGWLFRAGLSFGGRR